MLALLSLRRKGTRPICFSFFSFSIGGWCFFREYLPQGMGLRGVGGGGGAEEK